MAKKATVEGFEEGGEFHPIRDSKGYSARKAGEKKSKSHASTSRKPSASKHHAAKSHRGGAGKLHGRRK